MAAFHGIQVYEILDNGNVLNAIYTNNLSLRGGNYDVDNEIARKRQFDDKGVDGHYDCRYIETGNASVVLCDLEIRRRQEVYEFIWSQKGKPIWKGLGLLAGNNHVSVSYVKP